MGTCYTQSAMRPKSLPSVEAESLELARIVMRERELLGELDALKIEKRKCLAAIRELAAAEPQPEQRQESKKERVQKAIFGMALGTQIVTANVAAQVDIDPDIVSNYLSGMAREGYLRRLGRGKFIVERTVM
jgi:hypothetical protein